MSLNILEILTLFGAIQGFGLTSVLWFSGKHRSYANRILALFVFIFSLHLVREILQTHGYLNNWPFLAIISLTFTGYYAPLIFIYVCALLKENKYFHPGTLKHFGIAFAVSVTFAIASLSGISDWSHLESNAWLFVLVSILQGLIIIQSIVYLSLSFKTLREYRVWLKDNYSTIDRLGYLWLSRLLGAFASIVAVWLFVFGADLRFLGISYQAWVFDCFWLMLAVFIYWIGYFSLLKPEVVTGEFKAKSKSRPADVLNIEKIHEYMLDVKRLFEQDKVYLDPDLTLKQLAKKIELNEKKLTQVLNIGFEQSFYNLINQYRVEEVKRILLLPENVSTKLEVLAYEAGFKSPSTFNRQFKNITDMTPREYRDICFQSNSQ